MDVIPVLDVRGGTAVRADGGERSAYPPLHSVFDPDPSPAALARAMRGRLGLARVYVADLDALERGDLGVARRLVRELGEAGAAPWIEAGASSVAAIRLLLEAGAERVVVGLETLPEVAALPELASAADASRLAFSLDVRHGRAFAPRMTSPPWPEEICRLVVEAGFETVIVLDLGRVGRRAGPPSTALAELRLAATRVRWYAGGGVRDAADLAELTREGWDGCLVGTALHDGTLGRAELAAASAAGTRSRYRDSVSVSR